MDSFKPTDDQLFDCHLGLLDPETKRHVEIWLDAHPAMRVRLREFDRLENGFQCFPLKSPSQEVLNRVHRIAREKVRPSVWETLKTVLVPRQIGWALVIFMITGLGYFFNQLPKENVRLTTVTQPQVMGGLNGQENGVASFSGSLTEQILLPKNVDHEHAKILEDYARALSYYHQSRFTEANHLFKTIIAAHPRFEKRVELYTYWIKTLEKMGDRELAREKQLELKNIQAEEKAAM